MIRRRRQSRRTLQCGTSYRGFGSGISMYQTEKEKKNKDIELFARDRHKNNKISLINDYAL